MKQQRVPPPSVVGLEHPLFGQFARQLTRLPAERLAAGLEQQSQTGGHLGEILRGQGLLTRQQIAELLKSQARWVARSAEAEAGAGHFPAPVFLSLCLPAFNEATNIEDTLDAACAILPEFVERFEVVVVDDGSRDGTGDIVASYAGRQPRVRLVRHQQNQGYGAAVTSGLRAAQGDLVAFTDSDGQFSLLDLPQLLVHFDADTVVIGYRYQRADNWVRRLNAWAWNRLIGYVLGVHVRDLDCAFKLFPRKVIDRLSLTSPGAAINAEMLVQCVRGGVRIYETPVSHYPRCAGAPTGAALKVILRAFRDLPGLWSRYRAANPGLFELRREPTGRGPVPTPAGETTAPLPASERGAPASEGRPEAAAFAGNHPTP